MVKCIRIILLRLFNICTITNFDISNKTKQVFETSKFRYNLIRLSTLIIVLYTVYTAKESISLKNTSTLAMSYQFYILALRFMVCEPFSLVIETQLMQLIQALLQEELPENEKWFKACLFQMTFVTLYILYRFIKSFLPIYPLLASLQGAAYLYMAYNYLTKIILMQFIGCFFISRWDWLIINFFSHTKAHEIYYRASQFILRFNFIFGLDMLLTLLAMLLLLGASGFYMLGYGYNYDTIIHIGIDTVSVFMLCYTIYSVSLKVRHLYKIKQ